MEIMTAKELNRYTKEAGEALLKEKGYDRIPTQMAEVWGKEVEYSTHMMTWNENGWHEPTELLFAVAEYHRLDGWVCVRLTNQETVSSCKERLDGKALYKPDEGGNRYLKYSVVLHDDCGKMQMGAERYLLIRA